METVVFGLFRNRSVISVFQNKFPIWRIEQIMKDMIWLVDITFIVDTPHLLSSF
jgi:hypothetical protein